MHSDTQARIAYQKLVDELPAEILELARTDSTVKAAIHAAAAQSHTPATTMVSIIAHLLMLISHLIRRAADGPVPIQVTHATGRRPHYFPTRLAAEYLAISHSRVLHLVGTGALRPAGRRGGNGCYVFERAELDRWMRGEPIKEDSSDDGA